MVTQVSEKFNGQIFTNRYEIMRISTDFYKDLYTSSKVDTSKQERLLRNDRTKLSQENMRVLEAALKIEEFMFWPIN